MTHPAPLSGVTVLSLAINLPGPLAAARLHEFGAHVIKVEPPAGDPLDAYAKDYYTLLAEGQQIETIDLKTAEGQAQLAQLAQDADILITSMRPSAARRLGVPELVATHNLVHVEIVGFAGEREEVPGHDLTYQAAYGTVLPDGAMPTVPVADVMGGERAASAALAGLRQITEGGTGVVHRVALDEAAAWAANPLRFKMTGPGTLLGGHYPFYRTYQTADGHLAVAALEPQFSNVVKDQLGETHEDLEAVFATRTTAEWMEFAQVNDLPFEPVGS